MQEVSSAVVDVSFVASSVATCCSRNVTFRLFGSRVVAVSKFAMLLLLVDMLHSVNIFILLLWQAHLQFANHMEAIAVGSACLSLVGS